MTGLAAIMCHVRPVRPPAGSSCRLSKSKSSNHWIAVLLHNPVNKLRYWRTSSAAILRGPLGSRQKSETAPDARTKFTEWDDATRFQAIQSQALERSLCSGTIREEQGHSRQQDCGSPGGNCHSPVGSVE